jgi:hypothetical protein
VGCFDGFEEFESLDGSCGRDAKRDGVCSIERELPCALTTHSCEDGADAFFGVGRVDREVGAADNADLDLGVDD